MKLGMPKHALAILRFLFKPELVLRLKPQQCMIKQGPFKLRETGVCFADDYRGELYLEEKEITQTFFLKLTTMDVRHLKAKYI